RPVLHAPADRVHHVRDAAHLIPAVENQPLASTLRRGPNQQCTYAGTSPARESAMRATRLATLENVPIAEDRVIDTRFGPKDSNA
ncbi:MAG: hypothetical protein AAF098_17130, partial [Pseudomonadota bacterium]